MKKGTRIFKQYLATFLIVLMSIESFAAVVGDNDGAAFITKAEFDSMKNDFQSQLDKYNSSIDNKIDGAIARYLDGIRIKRTIQLKNLVDNYNDMEWSRKWEVYGSYRDWTDFTTSTVANDVWYEPAFYKSGLFRQPAMNLGFSKMTFTTTTWICLTGKVNLKENALDTLWYNNYTMFTPHVWVLRCSYDDSKNLLLVDKPLIKIGSNESYMQGNWGTGYFERYSDNGGRTWTNVGSSWAWMYGPHRPLLSTDMRASWCQTQPLDADDQILNVKFIINSRNGRNNMVQGTIKQSVWQLGITSPVNFLQIEGNDNDVVSGKWDNIDNQNPHIFSNLGGHIRAQSINQTHYADQERHFKNLMLGDDTATMVNIIRRSDKVHCGSSLAVKTDLSEFATVNWYVNKLCVESFSAHEWDVDDGTAEVEYPNAVKVVLRKPYFERASFSELTSGKFTNETTMIKMGQGLPISKYLTSSGTLFINFDYSLNRLVDPLPSDATKIKIDVKKTNFNNNKDDYYRGQVDDGTSTVLLKDAESNRNATTTTNKNTKIVIEDVKEGDEVWIRIAPLVTTSGVYAKMSNLKVNIEIDG